MDREAARRAIEALLAEALPAYGGRYIKTSGNGHVVIGGDVHIHLAIYLASRDEQHPGGDEQEN